jgi:hypothetical protein
VSGQHSGPAHEGNSRTMGMHADEKSDGCVVLMKPRTMPSDIGGGDGGGKAAGRGEGELRRMLRTQRRNQHVTEAASPRIGAVWVPHTPKADRVRPKTGAGCGKAACPDLRGGRGAILVPTATICCVRRYRPLESVAPPLGSPKGRSQAPRHRSRASIGRVRIPCALPRTGRSPSFANARARPSHIASFVRR